MADELCRKGRLWGVFARSGPIDSWSVNDDAAVLIMTIDGGSISLRQVINHFLRREATRRQREMKSPYSHIKEKGAETKPETAVPIITLITAESNEPLSDLFRLLPLTQSL